MMSRRVIDEFLELYPWNSTEIQLDLEDNIIKTVSDVVATKIIFSEVGRRFYDYLRGRYDEMTTPTKENRMPDPDKDPKAVTEWIKKELDPKGMLQFFFTVSLPEITARLIYNDLSDESVHQEIVETSTKLLTDNTEFSKKIWSKFIEIPNSKAILEKYGINKNLE
jgi:hypothetical protein